MATQWTQLSPPQGFGENEFGDSTDDRTISIHKRGFGDPKTQWTVSHD